MSKKDMQKTANEQEAVAEQNTGEAKAGPVTITVDNPSKEEVVALSESIVADFDFSVNPKLSKFNFKKSKDKETGIITEREAVELVLPYVSVQGIIDIIEGKHLEEGQANKGLELLVDVMEDTVNAAARDLLYEDYNLNAGTFPVDKVSWEFIANIPKVARRGGGIPKEVWEAFAEDYTAIMPDITGKTIDAVSNAAKCLSAKLTSCRTNKPVLNLLVEQLAIYAENTENLEEYQDCVAFLLNKADTFLNTSDADLLANL